MVVFTGNPGLEHTPWWTAVLRTPGLDVALICRELRPRGGRSVVASIRRNVKKHGLIFIPYRAGVLALALLNRLLVRRSAPSDHPTPVPVDVIEAPDIHAADVVERVRAWRPDLGVSIGAPILRRALFGIPSRGTINLHCGKVPEYRGMPPGFWELYTGAREIGATVHWMEDGLDTGAIVARAAAPIFPTDTLARVVARSEELGVVVMSEALRALSQGNVPGTPQPSGGRTFRAPTLRQRLALAVRLWASHARHRLGSLRFLARTTLTLLWLWLVRPLRDLLRTLRGRHPVRVFTYHRVTDLCRDGMTLPASVLRRQASYLARHHTVVTLEEGLRRLSTGTRLRRPVAVITFDDGYRSVHEQALTVLAERGLPGCCFVTTDLLGTERRLAHDEGSPVREQLGLMTWDAVQDLRRAGWSVGGHTATHARLSACDDGRLRDELERPLAALRERLGLTSVAMAYTFGQPDDITPEGVRAVKECGYAALFSDFGGENFRGDDPFALKRIELGGDHDGLAWRARAHGLVWGAGAPQRRMMVPARSRPVALDARSSERCVRVTHVVHDLHGGGMESLVAEMARRYAGTSIVMSAITLMGRPGAVGASIRHLFDQYHVIKPLPLLSMALPLGLVRRIRATRPDVVHIHSAWYKGALAAHLAGVARVIYTEHGREHDDPPLMQWLDRRAASWTDVVVPVSERLNGYLRRVLDVPPERLQTIENGIDTDAFTPGDPSPALRAKLRIPTEAVVLGSIGRLEPVKGYDRLIRAFATLRRAGGQGRPVLLVLCGDGSERARLEALVAELGVGDAARLPGWTDQPADVYRLLDVFALTSHSEGASVSLMEAMACGCTPVVMDVGANAEIVGPALADRVVPAGDLDAFVRAATIALGSVSARARAGSLARQRVVERYGLDRMVAGYESLYRGALVRPLAGAPAR